eukprot:246574-Chlamydomonas_euryale.AAC.1
MDAAADACDALLQLTHDEFKQPAVRPPPPVQPPRAPQRRLHPGQPPRRLVVLQDLRQLVNQPHRHADGVVLQGQLLLPLNFDAILGGHTSVRAKGKVGQLVGSSHVGTWMA